MSKRIRARRGFGLMAPVLALLVLQGAARAAEVEAGPADPWALLALLEGSWEGEIDGKLGTGRGVRRYELLPGGEFLLCRHRSVRLPQEKSPRGDEHEELGVFSFDLERKVLMLREFMSQEGIVVLSSCAQEGTRIVCTSESVENGPGIRARLTLEIADRYRFTENYEIAWPGKPFEHYFTNKWTRSPVPTGWP